MTALYGAHRNLTGCGAILDATYWFSSRTDPQFDLGDALPLTARKLILFLRYRKDLTRVLEEPFSVLDSFARSRLTSRAGRKSDDMMPS
ncbi:hypothetical protein C2W62_21020 [Candidatus Entotheonella serta]|nr:hypothetical protein C2W62_21020 [Candidatus Entotheonella serta]